MGARPVRLHRDNVAIEGDGLFWRRPCAQNRQVVHGVGEVRVDLEAGPILSLRGIVLPGLLLDQTEVVESVLVARIDGQDLLVVVRRFSGVTINLRLESGGEQLVLLLGVRFLLRLAASHRQCQQKSDDDASLPEPRRGLGLTDRHRDTCTHGA